MRQPRLGKAAARAALLPLCAVLLAALPAWPIEEQLPDDEGVFLILAGERRVGTEKFKITSSDTGYEAAAELQLDPPGGSKTTERSRLLLAPDFRPLSYEREQRSPKKGTLTAEFGSPESTLVASTEAGTQNQIFFLPQNDLAVLDTNFFHQYAFLLRLYDRARPGPQHFNVFVPQEATPGTISLAFLGVEQIEIAGTAKELHHFQAVTDELQMEIWVTPEGKLEKLTVPQAKLEIVRQ